MKISKFWFVLLLSLIILVACEDNGPQGGGTLPEQAEELIFGYIKDDKKDESGGRIIYIKDANSEQPGEKLWCVNVRFVNTSGIFTAPFVVSQRGEEWRLDRTPEQGDYVALGCQWPESG